MFLVLVTAVVAVHVVVTGVMEGVTITEQIFSFLLYVVTAVVVDLGLVTTVIVVSKHDHGRDQSKTHTHEFSLKNFAFYLHPCIPITHTTRPRHLHH